MRRSQLRQDNRVAHLPPLVKLDGDNNGVVACITAVFVALLVADIPRSSSDENAIMSNQTCVD